MSTQPSGGVGTRRPRPTPKGRQLQAEALAEVRQTLGHMPRRRDLLLEMLHLIQDGFGCLHARHLRALSEELRLAEAEIYEVASFYHHFDIVKEGEAPPAPITVRVCGSLPCMLAGSEALYTALETGVDPTQVRVVHAPCVGRCAEAPAARVGRGYVDRATPASVLARLVEPADVPRLPHHVDLHAYRGSGGYDLLEHCLSGRIGVDDVIATLIRSGLAGLGGAGFPAGRKWSIVREVPGPRLMTINADEGEPGTFKDRHILESDPHRVLEGALIAAWAVKAERCYIYLRDEYPIARQILHTEIAALEAAGLSRLCPLELRRGAGSYVCGEESAMLESIEGKRGLPRHRPPYIAEAGLFGRPTLNHNVETLYWVRDILERGADWFAGQGVHGCKGLRSFSVSGRVREPGVVIAPAGSTAAELIERCGGMAEGHCFKAYLPGGASGGILPASKADIPLDFGTLEPEGCFIGSHAVIILSDQDDLGAAARNLMAFFADESCGQCTPCRVGCEKALQLLHEGEWDAGLLHELAEAMQDASICGLGQAAPNPILSVLKHFPTEAKDRTLCE